MINKQHLIAIFNTNDINYIQNCFFLKKNNIDIVIYEKNSYTHKYLYSTIDKFYSHQKRKNCFILKSILLKNKSKTRLYIYENHIKSIIRQKVINNILND